jgi:hypothetical protein
MLNEVDLSSLHGMKGRKATALHARGSAVSQPIFLLVDRAHQSRAVTYLVFALLFSGLGELEA